MKMSEYRKLVSSQVDTKRAKMGLRLAAKSSRSTNLALGVFGLTASVGNVISVLSPYLLGQPFLVQHKQETFAAMSGLGADIVFLAKLLKVKLPTPTKRAKIVGSRTERLLALVNTATQLQAVYANGTLAPQTKVVEKEVSIPSEGKKEMRNVVVLDKEATAAQSAQGEATMAQYLAGLAGLFWSLSFDMFQTPPEALFSANADALFAPEVQVQVATPAAPVKKVAKAKKVKDKAA